MATFLLNLDRYVYIVRCKDGSLYTGMAKDVQARVRRHNKGQGAKYTAGRGPVTLVYMSPRMSMTEAFSEEARIKRLSKKEKLKLCKI